MAVKGRPGSCRALGRAAECPRSRYSVLCCFRSPSLSRLALETASVSPITHLGSLWKTPAAGSNTDRFLLGDDSETDNGPKAPSLFEAHLNGDQPLDAERVARMGLYPAESPLDGTFVFPGANPSRSDKAHRGQDQGHEYDHVLKGADPASPRVDAPLGISLMTLPAVCLAVSAPNSDRSGDAINRDSEGNPLSKDRSYDLILPDVLPQVSAWAAAVSAPGNLAAGTTPWAHLPLEAFPDRFNRRRVKNAAELGDYVYVDGTSLFLGCEVRLDSTGACDNIAHFLHDVAFNPIVALTTAEPAAYGLPPRVDHLVTDAPGAELDFRCLRGRAPGAPAWKPTSTCQPINATEWVDAVVAATYDIAVRRAGGGGGEAVTNTSTSGGAVAGVRGVDGLLASATGATGGDVGVGSGGSLVRSVSGGPDWIKVFTPGAEARAVCFEKLVVSGWNFQHLLLGMRAEKRAATAALRSAVLSQLVAHATQQQRAPRLPAGMRGAGVGDGDGNTTVALLASLQVDEPRCPTRLAVYNRGDRMDRIALNMDQLLEHVHTRTSLEVFVVESFYEMPFEEQVTLFSLTDIMVLPYGAALTNTVFMARGAFVVEMSPLCLPSSWPSQKQVCHGHIKHSSGEAACWEDGGMMDARELGYHYLSGFVNTPEDGCLCQPGYTNEWNCPPDAYNLNYYLRLTDFQAVLQKIDKEAMERGCTSFHKS
eukprot:jgi/Mesvir1/24999/Mv16956-RA.1